jgi:hypothetical protein
MSYESHKYYNGNLYVNIVKYVLNQQLLMDLHVSIIMDVKNQQLLRDLYVGIVMVVRKPTTIMKLICEYCIFELVLWKL